MGKSSVTAHLARSLAVTADATLQIGILDVDICGPSQPQMLGLPEERMHTSQFGFAPVVSDEFGNVSVVSVGFLLEGETDAVIWRGPKKNALVKRFLRDVQWEEMDFLLVDTPPGTSDEHLALAQLISPITGAILVTTPQEIAWQDVRKEIDFCKKTGIPIIGIVENMAGFVCGHCHRPSEVFTSGSLREYTTHHGIPILASIPIDPTLGMACDRGERLPADSPLCGIYTDLASKIVAHVNR